MKIFLYVQSILLNNLMLACGQVLFCPEFKCEVCGHRCPLVDTDEDFNSEKQCFDIRCPECHALHEFPVIEQETACPPSRDEESGDAISSEEDPPTVDGDDSRCDRPLNPPTLECASSPDSTQSLASLTDGGDALARIRPASEPGSPLLQPTAQERGKHGMKNRPSA